MIGLGRVEARYRAATHVRESGVEVWSVAEPVTARFDAAVRALLRSVADADADPWVDLLGAAKQFRWRLAMCPAPAAYRTDDQDLALTLQTLCDRHLREVGPDTARVLQELKERAAEAAEADPETASLLASSLIELNFESCVVVVGSARVHGQVEAWFSDVGIPVPILQGGFRALPGTASQAYVLGIPSSYSQAVLCAPRADDITFIVPSWARDRRLPTGGLSGLAENPYAPESRLFFIGSTEETLEPGIAERDLVPQPIWRATEDERPPRHDEVMTRKVLLSGSLAVMLDVDGEHIRTLNPTQPAGERVELAPVNSVRPGTYLVLREGATQADLLHERAIVLLGEDGAEADAAQRRWKEALRARLEQDGQTAVIISLAEAGVRRAYRAPAWSEPSVVRPQSNEDFARMLDWLGLPQEPHFRLANMLRRARIQAAQDVRRLLEDAVSTADLDELDRVGHIRLHLDAPGFRGIVATRVLAISPTQSPCSRADVRTLFNDGGSRWLE